MRCDDPAFLKDLQELILKYKIESDSNTPDFILAQYMVRVLHNFSRMTVARETWYGRDMTLGAPE